jgi:hypothetical protein
MPENMVESTTIMPIMSKSIFGHRYEDQKVGLPFERSIVATFGVADGPDDQPVIGATRQPPLRMQCCGTPIWLGP